MDKLTKEAADHEKFSEMLAFYEKALAVGPELKTGEAVRDFVTFLDEYVIDHFRFEENEIFPLIERSGTEEERKLLEGLTREHREVTDRVKSCIKIVLSIGSEVEGKQAERLKESARVILEMMMSHAELEDRDLLPLIEKYQAL